MTFLNRHEPAKDWVTPLPQAERGLDCEIVRDFARLEELGEEWERLWRADPRAEFFQSFTWAHAWWKSFGGRSQLCTAVVYEEGEVVLILPLVLAGNRLRFLGSPENDYADVLCWRADAGRYLEVALRALAEHVHEWRECVFDHLRPDSHMVRAWEDLPRDLRHSMRLEASDSCPTIVFGERRNEVIDPLLASKHLRRRLNKLQKAGKVTFRHLEDKDEAQEQLTNFFQCHRRRCAALAKTSCFEEPQMRSMMRTLVEHSDLRAELRFGILKLNGRPMAWSFGFQIHGKYSYYQQTFDIDVEEYAPGEVLLRYLLEYAKGVVEREFDFLRGDEFFKKRFANTIIQNQCLYFERPGQGGQLRLLGRSMQGRLHRGRMQVEDVVRRSESFFQVVRSIWMWRRKAKSRWQWAKANRRTLDYFSGAGCDLLGHTLWNKRIFTLFQTKAKDEEVCPVPLTGLASHPQITVTVAKLSDLADLALEHPEIPFPDFREYRNRLKRGDRVYALRENGRVALVAWTGCRAGPRPAVAANPAFTMYECWPMENLGTGCTELLTELAAQASAREAGLLIGCPAIPAASRMALKQRGFFPKLTIKSGRLLRWFRYEKVRDYRERSEGPCMEAAECPKLASCRMDILIATKSGRGEDDYSK